MLTAVVNSSTAFRASPVSLEAYETYMRQVDLFCALEYTESVEVGRQAVALSPDYIPALNQMGVALSNLGRNEEADSVYAILGGLRDQMTSGERNFYDWMIGNRTGDPTLAARAAVFAALMLDGDTAVVSWSSQALLPSSEKMSSR